MIMSQTAATAVRSAFRVLSKIRCNGLIDVTKYASERTGLKVTIADVKGPIVHGCICLATETDSDDGLPHTLEHLVFMGSEKYPVKGLLDLVANRCLASGTNAWTDTDHTCYTLTTAGSEGFLIMLPIYMDHIFRPLLTEAQFITEVHHINGQGEDGGVVYCEMQEHESEMSNMIDWAFKKRMFPQSGYGVETGGRLHNLRTSTTYQKVKNYHASYYTPRNCEIIISGSLDHERVFRALDEVEETIMEKKLLDTPSNRPWTTPIRPLEIKPTDEGAVEEIVITCPSDDGESGGVQIGWRGPPVKDYYEFRAISLLFKYLTNTAVSPFERDLIQISDPYCAEVTHSIYDTLESCVTVEFRGVMQLKLRLIRPKVMEILQNIATELEPLDMGRMDDILMRAVLKTESKMESDARQTVPSLVIGDFLYGNSEDDFNARLNDVAAYKKLRGEPKEFWIGLIRRYFTKDRPHICVIGEPSTEKVKEMTNADKKRLKEQKARLGPDGLKMSGEKLKAAMEENSKNKPPLEVMERCIVNSLNGIDFFTLQTTTNRSVDEDKNQRFPLNNLPFTAILDDGVGTNFVNLTMQMDTSQLSTEMKPLIFLLSTMLFESPIMRNGEIVPYEKVVAELSRDLVSHSAGAGVAGRFLRVVSLDITVDVERYRNAVEWMSRLLYDIQFTADRIKVIGQRMINLANEYKRDGETVARFLIGHLTYQPRTQPLLYDVILQEKYLKNLLKTLKEDPNKVIAKFNQLRDEMTAPDRLVLSIFCESEKLKSHYPQPDQLFTNGFLPARFNDQQKKNRAAILGGSEPTYVKNADQFNQSLIATVGSCESCYTYQTTPCGLRYEDVDYPIMRVLLQYLTQCEGPLWKEIRGRGLSYGVSIDLHTDQRLLQAYLYRTSDPVVAYKETKRVVDEFLQNPSKFDKDEFEAAKRSLIYAIVSKESTIHAASTQSVLSYYRGIPQDYSRKLLHKIWDVRVDQLAPVGRKYLPQLFDVQKSNFSITCHPSKLDETVSGFKEFGRNLRVVTVDDEEFYK